MAMDPKYTWDEGERKYRDKFGRFVARTAVRASLDEYLDNVVLEIRGHTEALQDGRIEISEWQTRMEASVKRGHTAATAIGRGGWKQVKPEDWGRTGQTIQFHYSKLRRFAMELEAGVYPMDGRLLNRAEMYGLGPTSTYEKILRKGDVDAGYRWEKRILHSSNSCKSCERYYDMDWQPIGVLPNIGEQCQCLTRCRCTFERSKSEFMPKRRKEQMSIEGMNDKKCDERRRQAAVRDRVDAAPVRFLLGREGLSMDGSGYRLAKWSGEIPQDDPTALTVINRRRKEFGESRLELGDIYIHYLEAANSNFIGDRYMFLDASSLKRFADMSEKGISFMNSHRTGGLSSPAQLPYGRSFSGRYEEFVKGDEVFRRTLMGIYMVRGQYPNGTESPSTDALHVGIESGTIADVSVGLNHEGDFLCDVCGEDLEFGNCKHIPGSTYSMSKEEQEAQSERGIVGGRASYTAYNAGLREVSAVYKGAVPGAGFRKSLQHMDSPEFVTKHGKEILSAYGPMFKRRHVSKLQGKNPMDWAKLFAFLRASGEIDDAEFNAAAGTVVPPTAPKAVEVKPSAEDLSVKSERDKLAAERAELDNRARTLDLNVFTAEAKAFCATLKDKATPFELTAIEAGYVAAAMDDKYSSKVEYGEFKVESRLKVFKDAHSSRKPLDLKTEKVGDSPMPIVGENEKVLSGEADPNPDPEKPTPERLMQLCNSSEEGKAALAALAALAASKK